MSLFKLHRIVSPEINKILKERDNRLEHTINLYRLFLFGLMGVGGFVSAYFFGHFNREFILLRIFILLANLSLIIIIHFLIKKKKNNPFLKYITVTFDITFVFIINIILGDFILKLGIYNKVEFLILVSILFFIFNLLSALRIKKYVIYYSTLLAISLNVILHFNGGSNIQIISFTSFVILISGFYNLWISNFIMQSFIANHRLSGALNKVKQANEEITAQRDQIAIQSNRITDSISYARRIQNTVLTQADEINEVTPDNFILYWPKDIVSGDFYWFKNVEVFTKQYKVIAVVDCTGHGVPGAFMSMLGTSFLNEIILEFYSELKANEILNRLREEVKEHLHQSKNKNSSRDGMDIALSIIDYEDMKMQYAGAHNPLYLVRSPNNSKTNEIEEIKGDKMPIGISLREEKTFTNHIIDIEKGDMLYLFSDGYADQFGGSDRKKYNTNRFKQKILDLCQLPLSKQRSEFETEMKNWMGETHEQLDDITMVGIKV